MGTEDFYRRLLDQLYDGVYFVDRTRRITYWNAAAEQITGYVREEVVGSFCFNNILRHIDKAGAALCLDGCPLHGTIRDGIPRQADVFLHHKNGQRVPVHIRVTPMHDDEGNLVGAGEIFSRRTVRAEAERRLSELRRRLFVDPLTQVPNRQYAERTIHSLLVEMQNGGSAFGALFMDIDRFKTFNDEHGHEVGDRALKIVAGSLASCVRPTDVIARWGGEEFVGLFRDVDEAGLGAVSAKLLAVVRGSDVPADGKRLPVTISIGATLARPEDDSESLLRRADALMYRSKAAGRDRVTIG
jgi:diguanylate cyclase (GGDEF)-like protein/PAS domain S-box-containing protein